MNIFGGKITTYRRLAESALEKIGAHLPLGKGPWTAGVPLPGGDFAVDGFDDLVAKLRMDFPFMDEFWARRLVRAYGTQAADILGDAKTASDLGQDFGATLRAAEVRWLITHEYAHSAADIVWRRTKLGLRMAPEQISHLDTWIAQYRQSLSKTAG